MSDKNWINGKPDAELDFSKICRVCLKEGVMMSIFKVNVSKKMMSCASVQVSEKSSKIHLYPNK